MEQVQFFQIGLHLSLRLMVTESEVDLCCRQETKIQ